MLLPGFFLLLDPASGHDHPFAHGCDHQPIAVCVAGFFQHTVNIGPHRGLAHIQLYGNLGIGFSLAEQAQSLYLTVRQVAGELVATIL